MHSTDATDGTDVQSSTPIPTRPMIELRTGEVIAEVVDGVTRRAFKPGEVAIQLGVSERYVWTLIESGDLLAIPLAGRKMVLAEDLESFINRLKKERDKARDKAGSVA